MGKADIEKIYTAVDWEKYASREKIALTVEGWIASVDSRPIEIQLRNSGNCAWMWLRMWKNCGGLLRKWGFP